MSANYFIARVAVDPFHKYAVTTTDAVRQGHALLPRNRFAGHGVSHVRRLSK